MWIYKAHHVSKQAESEASVCFKYTVLIIDGKTLLVLWRYYANQKKTLEVNPRHPLVKELKRRVDDAEDDQTTKDLAFVLYETATLRSGYALPDTADFAGRVERMLRLSMNVGLDEQVTSCILCV